MAEPGLGTRLAAEFKRSGKKTGILLGLLVLGSYYWLPLLKGALRVGSNQTEPAAPSTATASSLEKATAESAPGKPVSPGDDWRSLRRRVSQSKLIEPATPDAAARDPFDAAWLKREADLMAKAATTPPVRPRRPTLSTIVVGPDVRMAIIDGNTLREGDAVPSSDADHPWRVREIARDRVILHRDGETMPLELVRGGT